MKTYVATRKDLLTALKRIKARAKPHPSDTDADRKRYLSHVLQIAEAAINAAEKEC